MDYSGKKESKRIRTVILFHKLKELSHRNFLLIFGENYSEISGR